VPIFKKPQFFFVIQLLHSSLLPEAFGFEFARDDKWMLSVMQISHDEDSYEYSFDEFASQCDQLGLSSIRDKSKSIPKCFGSRDSETVDNANSVEDDFESPIKETVGENASSQDREQSVNKVEQLTQPVLKSAAPDHENLQEEVSVSSQSQGEHEDQYIVVIVAKPLDAHTTPDVQSNSKGKKNCGAVCLPADAQYQEEAKESLHFEHTERSASSVPRSFAKTKSMKLKNAGCMLSEKKEPARQSHYSLERLAQLSKPTERRSDDYYKTTHKPKKTSIDPSEGGPNFADFLERMESKEAERRERAQRAAAKALYDAKVDKVISCAAALDLSLPPLPSFTLLSGIHRSRMFVRTVEPSNRLRKCIRVKWNVTRMVVEVRSIAMFHIRSLS
jgi:hypothetical protein